MGITAISGSFAAYGQGVGEKNEDIGPSSFACGQGFVDIREPFQYLGVSSVKTKIHGFPQLQWIQTINATLYPGALFAQNPPLVDLQPGVPLPLITAGIPGATPGMSVRETGTGKIIKNVLMLGDFNLVDYNGTLIATTASAFDPVGNVACWDPAYLLAQRIFWIGGGNPNDFLITGIDAYGYLMSEKMSSVAIGGNTVASRKAFKGIISVIPTQVDSSVVQTSFISMPEIGLPMRYDYPYSVMSYNAGALDNTSSNYESSLYTITNITPSGTQLTITIAPSNDPSFSQEYTLPVGSKVTISRCNPSSYNTIYTVLTSAPGTFTVASTVTDPYVSGGSIFCDKGGLETKDVRGVYIATSSPDPINVIIYQSISLQNMQTSVGQFGIPQFSQ